jgi:signal transduction histidine kinase
VALALSDEQVAQVKDFARRMVREPFAKRTWAEFGYFVVTTPLTVLAIAFVGATMFFGILFAITFVGLLLLALSLRGARVIGGLYRGLARRMLGEEVEDPEPFVRKPGILGWLQSSLRDGVAWRTVAYVVIRVPWTIIGIFAAVSLWWDAVALLLAPLYRGDFSIPPTWGAAQFIFRPERFGEPVTFGRALALFLLGLLLLFAAPWVMRGFVNIDRLLMGALLGPDPVQTRVRLLERARTQTVDTSAATLRRIERDLHDGTQAQLVALAMRLGMAKEKLENLTADIDGDGDGAGVGARDQVEFARIRDLVDEAHRGAKEAIVELRDIARGIHPPALDVGLEGALATLAARSTVSTEVSVDLQTRPTPAIEAITYYCAAELLANVAQHARASRASLTCAQQGTWLRLVVRDDGRGGAQLSTTGSSSSGLAGLVDRVRVVDGRLSLVSPPGGPTVVTVDLPLAA